MAKQTLKKSFKNEQIMNKKLKSILAITVILFTFLPLVALSQQQKAKSWPVPAEFKNKANPVKVTAASIADGKEAYKKCSGCHGKAGLGDGPKGKTLDTFPGDFTLASFQNQTDGEQFWRTKTGRDEMPGYKGKLTDEEIWSVVNYMRTFKK